jgi:uncharacterized membrane protein YdjX (TVP38/TMEM64 family)
MAAWRWTPLAESVTPDRLAQLAAPLADGTMGPWMAAGGICLASLILVPITMLVMASALTFGWMTGAAVGLAGAMASAMIAFALGRWLPSDYVQRASGPRLRRLRRRLRSNGVLAVALVRVVPVAPFPVVNMAAGAAGISARDFFLGSVVGMAPGAVALALAADRAVAAIRDPSWTAGLVAAGAMVAFVAIGRMLRRWLDGRRGGDDG